MTAQQLKSRPGSIAHPRSAVFRCVNLGLFALGLAISGLRICAFPRQPIWDQTWINERVVERANGAWMLHYPKLNMHGVITVALFGEFWRSVASVPDRWLNDYIQLVAMLWYTVAAFLLVERVAKNHWVSGLFILFLFSSQYPCLWAS